MASLKNIVQIGASGNLGGYILRALVADGSFNITVVTRTSSTATYPDGIKVSRVPDDYPDDAMAEVFKGQDAVIFSVGHTAAAHQKRLVDLAAATGIKRWIPTEFGSNSRNAGAIEVFPLLGAKADVNAYLRSKEADGLSWTAIATGPFFDLCLMVGFLGFKVQDRKATIYDSGDVAFSVTTRVTVGTAVAAVLKRPAETANKYIYVSSFEVTPNQILAALEKATGEKFEVEHVSSDDMIVKGREEWARGEFAGMAKLLLAATCKGGLGADFAKEESLANELLGLPKEDLDTVVVRVLEKGE